MHIRLVEVANFRGIKTLRWSPREGVNCLIGPGDSTKTTILDAVELALNPRSYSFADDSDFYDLGTDKPVLITVTIGDLPPEFLVEAKYGLHTRGWDAQTSMLIDEPGKGFEEVLSIRVEIDKALEAHWSLFNDRLDARESDPPMIRYKDMQRITSSRLGPFASRHFTWGRGSVLGQLDEEKESVSLELAEAGRAARAAFKKGERAVFSATAERVEKLSKHFSVPVRSGYRADLDVESVSVNSGGISLHDGNLPLRRLGSGSARLLVSALQGEAAADAHVALIDEIEHGLEPHRIARLAQYLRGKGLQPEASVPGQIFATTHSPVVVREFSAEDLCVVRCENGETVVRSIPVTLRNTGKAQALTRSAPEAFLARRVLIGEGKTEAGLLRGLDDWWIAQDKLSCAYLGICVIEGSGKDHAPAAGVALRALGYDVALLLDSDEPPNEESLREFDALSGRLIQWEENCSTEQRVFIDVPWATVRALISYAVASSNEDSVLAHIRNACAAFSLPPPPDLTLPASLDTKGFRQALGSAAKKKEAAWFKDIDRGKDLAGIIAPVLAEMSDTPFAVGIKKLRQWIDAAPG